MTLKTLGKIVPSEVKKIGVLRANALGDFIVILPALHALRASFRNAEIILFGKEWHRAFLEEEVLGKKRSPVDRVMVVPVMKGIREEKGKEENEAEVEQFFNAVQKESFDLCFSFQGKGIAGIPFIRRTGAAVTAGLSCESSEKPDLHAEYYYYQSEVIRYLEVAALAGASPAWPETWLHILDKDYKEAEAFLGKNVSRPYVVMHPCGTDMRRMWSQEKWKELALAISKMDLQVVFTGSKEDRKYISHIMPEGVTGFIDSSGLLSLGALGALFRRSKLVVSVDTGPLHMAIAVGAKTIGLYWAPNLINWAPLSRKHHRPVIDWNMLCPKCGIIPNDPFPYEPVSSSCDHSFSFIRNISVSQVLQEVNLLLK